MKDLNFLASITKSLLENGIDYEVELRSNTTVRLFDMLTGSEIAVSTGNSLEEALASVLGHVVGRSKVVENRLSIL